MTSQAQRLSLWPIAQKVTAETGSATTRAREADLDAIERFFVVEDRSAVRGFVTQRPFLIPLLFEAYQKIALFFSSAPLRLTVTIDPEDDTRRLTLTIITHLSASDAGDCLQQLDDQWWLDALDRARNALSISISSDEL